LFAKVVLVYHSVSFLEDLFDMFGFVSKFKNEVIAGFDAVHQRLVTLEAKVEALFEHTKTVAEAQAATTVEAAKADVANVTSEAKTEVAAVTTEVSNVETAAEDVATATEAVKNAS
jgi:hypothetical protein